LKVIDCRICGDPHSVLRFAFVEFADERKFLSCKSYSLQSFTSPKNTWAHTHTNNYFSTYFIILIMEFMSTDGARAALNLGGTVLGYYPVRVLPSKTAILPVNPTFLPRV
jgi:hypothetical protein